MLSFLLENYTSLIIGAIVLGVLAIILVTLARNVKAGKSMCSSCTSCSSCSHCKGHCSDKAESGVCGEIRIRRINEAER